MPSMRAKATNPEVLARLDKLGMADMKVESEVQLPGGFLSKARRGRGAGPKAAASWEKLTRWLDARDAALAPPKAATFTTTASKEDSTVRLVELIRVAKTRAAVDALIDQILEDIATGDIEPSKGRVLIECLKEKRQVLDDLDIERRELDSGKPVQVEIVWRNDWRGKIEANLELEALDAREDEGAAP